MTELRNLPVGEEYLSNIRKNDFYYVDKTGMITEFFRTRGFVNLFTRPRRFGKSLNMDMFKCFLETGNDPSLFHGLAVMEEKDLCAAHMGKYPVISISLKGIGASTYGKSLKSLSHFLREEARRHEYLLNSDRLSKHDKAALNELFSPRLDEDVQKISLRLLSEMLAKHFGTKAVLLIDEYDVPLDKAWQNHYYDEMVDFIRDLFGNVLKTNPYLEFAIITGCLRIARESIFTGINNFKVNTVSDDRFSQYFGFTSDEVHDLLYYYGIPEKYAILKEWYDGYRFGSNEIYCPWDVINQVDKFRDNPNAALEPYWANSSSNYIIRELLENPTAATQTDLEKLISGEPVTKTIIPELTYADFDTDDEELRQNYVWSVLYATGYLTDAKDYHRLESSLETRQLIIPNREIQKIYETQIRTWFRKKTRRHTEEWEEFCGALLSGDAPKLQERLNGFLAQSISIRDTFVRKEYKENFYHGLVLGLLKADGRWSVQSNAESGIGYTDIQVIAYSRKTGCTIEIKYAENGNFDAACREAMQQIEDNDYASVLRLEDIQTIHKYGIAFYKKACRVQYRKD